VADNSSERMTMTRFIVWLAALVCLVQVSTLRDVSERSLWAPRAGAPPLPESVSERDAELRVTVVDQNDEPAEGVSVRVFAIIGEQAYFAGLAVSDADGRAPIGKLPAGEIWILAEREGLARVTGRLVLEAGTRELSMKLHDAESFEVVVVDPMQRPIRGVQVTLYGADPLPYRVLTDGRGLARLTGLGPPPYAVDVRAAGFDSKFLPELGLEDSPVFVKLERLGGLEVYVVDADGNPASGATVLVAGSSLWPARSTTTNEQGHVTVSGLSRGFYDIRAERDDLVSDTELGIMLQHGETKEVKLHLVAGAYVTVTVTDGDGEGAAPIAEADVALVEGGVSSFPRYGRTGKEGTVRLGPMVGSDATVSARADGFVPHSAVVLEEGVSEIRISLTRGAKLVGEVVDERGFPIDGAQLEVVGVDLDGMPVIESSTIMGFRSDHFDFALPGAAPLLPAGELGVMPMIPDQPRDMGPLMVQRSEHAGTPWVSRSDGSFTLTPVTPGSLRVVVRHPSYVEAMSEPLQLEPGAEGKLRIVMRKGGILEGRVIEVDRAPVSGARIEIASLSGSTTRVSYAAEDGSFAFAALPSEVVLSVSRREAPEHVVERLTVDVPPDERREVEIILQRKRDAVVFRTIDDRGFPLDRVEVRVSSLDPREPLVKTIFSDDSGEALLRSGRGLPLRVVARRRGKAPGVYEIVDAPSQFDLVLRLPLSVEGSVESRNGVVEGATITLQTPTATRRTRTDERGEFRIDDLAASSARLLVQKDGHAPEQRDVDVEGDGRRPVSLGRIELAEGGTVSGVVLDEDGEPVAGARVASGRVPTYLPLGPLPLGIVSTNRQGRFTLDGLPPGKTEIEAYKVGYGRQAAIDVEVRAGQTNSNVEIEMVLDPEVEQTRVNTSGSLAVSLGELVEGGRRVVLLEYVPLNGEAQRAGIRAGDRFVSYNGVPIRSLVHARRTLNGPVSEDFVMELERGDDLRWRVRVKRERLRR
jgi:protocatechuate 3,4-dioxygenase beta subunit